MGIVKYRSNNSGGSWWLTTEDWKKLHDAGWVVHWVHDPDDPSHSHSTKGWEPASPFPHTHGYDDEHKLTRVVPSGETWLDALARSCAKETDDPDKAVREWEKIVGQSANVEGCPCCGPPHEFSYYDDRGGVEYLMMEDGRWI